MEEYIFTQGRPFFKELSMLIIEAIEESHIALNRGRSNWTIPNVRAYCLSIVTLMFQTYLASIPIHQNKVIADTITSFGKSTHDYIKSVIY